MNISNTNNRPLTNNEQLALKKVVNAVTKEVKNQLISGNITSSELLNEVKNMNNNTSGGAKKPKSKKSPVKKPKSKKSPAKKPKSKKSPAKKPKRKSPTKK